MLIDVAFDLELSASNTMSFVPVYLRLPDGAIRKPDTGNTLSFPPAAASIELAQSPDFSNRRAGGKRLDLGDFSDDLEIHLPMLSNHRDVVKLLFNVPVDARMLGRRLAPADLRRCRTGD